VEQLLSKRAQLALAGAYCRKNFVCPRVQRLTVISIYRLVGSSVRCLPFHESRNYAFERV
jgi:hypothetical protein